MFQDRTYTRDDYEALLARYPDRRLELIDGQVIENMPTLWHGIIIHLISGFLFVYLRDNPIGHVSIEGRYGLPDDEHNVRMPDLSFFRHETGDIVERGPAPFMPDLAVEVQSPGQSDRLMSAKAAYYLARGVHMVWLVYPDRRLVEVLTPEHRQLLTAEGTLSGGAVLPGFSVAVADILPERKA